MSEVFLTQQGYAELETKLAHLKSVKRTEVSEKIKVAREFGDISENAEYDAAKDEQAMIEGLIIEIEAKLAQAKIIEEIVDVSRVSIGSTVKLRNLETNAVMTYQIVGTTEADPFNNRISNESPVGKAVLGHTKGNKVSCNTPRGTSNFKIEEISR